MRQITSRSLPSIVAALLALAAACSDSDSGVDAVAPSEATAEEGEGEWIKHTLGTFAADRDIVGTPFGEGIAMLTVEELGDVHGYRLEPDGTMQEASVNVGASEHRTVTAITDGPTAWWRPATSTIPTSRTSC